MTETLKYNDQKSGDGGLPVSTDKISLVTKIYIWSVIFEPLIYFVLASGGQNTGIPFSVSRFLQVLVVVSFIFRILSTRPSSVRKQLFTTHLNKYFVYYLLILLVSSIFGMFIFHSYDVTIKNDLFNNESEIPFFKSKYVRPFFDIFLVVYYYFYFILLAKYYINTREVIKYFFKYTIFTFYLALLFGFIDLGFSLLGGALIKRHIGESTDVGFRFHSFAGEPRDAFVYLVYGSCILIIYNSIFSEIRLKKTLLILILAAIILTQSASGILGVFIGGALALSYFLSKKNRRAFYFLGIFAAIICLIVVLIPYSPRVKLYIEGFSTLYDDLKNGNELPYILLVQSVNFLPFWGMFNQFMHYNFFQLLFGSGFSSAAYFNMNYLGDYSYANPNAQFTRLLYEGGIIGALAYLLFLIKPAIQFLKLLPGKARYNSIFLFFLLTGAALAHRSLIPFIFTGIILAYNNIYRPRLI